MKAFFLALSGIFAAIPGLSVLLTSVGVPDPDDKVLFTAVIEVLGCAALGLILLNRQYFAALDKRKLTRLIISCFILFLISLVLYVVLFKICVITHNGNTPVYFPLLFNDALTQEVAEYGGKMGFIEHWLGDGSNMLISKLASTQLLITTILFMFIYQLVFTSLAAGFGMLGVTQEKKEG